MKTLPRAGSSIMVIIGGLALFLVFASWGLISHPSASTVIQGSFNPSIDQSVIPVKPEPRSAVYPAGNNDTGDAVEVKYPSGYNVSDVKELAHIVPPWVVDDLPLTDDSRESNKLYVNSTLEASLSPLSAPKVKSESCDMYNGKWFHDSAGPLYTNNSCPIITNSQNCQGNGRPDKDYENYRWKPTKCGLPRFDPKEFLKLMRGKTIAFIGDSVARNQMESLLCILWQVETPTNHGDSRMHDWLFKSTSTRIVRIWSAWLIHKTLEPFDFAPKDVVKLHLDSPDENFMEFLPTFDVVVISSGHWYVRKTAYIYKNEIVGGQLWWPDKSRRKKMDNVKAFGISVETILSAIATHPNYSGLVIVRSYSPDHYEGGSWNTGGSCTDKVKPATDAELANNRFTNDLHKKQVTGFNRAVKKQTNKSRFRYMDITKAYSYRHDGHPGPYRSRDPHKKTTRGPHGEPPPQDCLHWCMPGPVDTWNELAFEIIKRDLESAGSLPT
ncbi:hypothetical protein GIB67_029926 [Kingdonia uniflora]|uniref:Trichome birefringence-like N-terminal domain-containing protein n=1 Tax=Kingdonia uniflora TaxID=39325 RepID=A0A7J7MYA9_9MAGN|nr:hypothetical protein GIB67_029926 [Kingdonia uniflora]